MADLFAWLISFFLIIATLGIILYQLMCLADLESDYINPYDSASRINMAILPEFIIQGILCVLHLITGHWMMLLLCLPYLYYNVKLYTQFSGKEFQEKVPFGERTEHARIWAKRMSKSRREVKNIIDRANC